MMPSVSVRCLLFILLSVFLVGCKVDMYTGLSEEQANQMLSTLLRRGIEAEKISAGKNGYTLAVDDSQLILALQILKENSLPREAFKSMGDVFGGEGMISSSSEEQARLSYALSQELSDTLSRIDGVLTARVHVVLGVNDPVNNIRVEPSAAVFLRHTPDSPVVNFVPKIRELAASSVAQLRYDNVSVMLVPVRESVTVPEHRAAPASLFAPGGLTLALIFQVAAMALLLVGVVWGGRVLLRRAALKRKASKTTLTVEQIDA
ncbi:MAG: type III secretion inner membrane ring lipoprotein SctJ [Desulfovibrio sp.]|nr:type III secretion inner membrane ring lipoprotein SctJ [Desulfovibrio sp.]